MKYDLKYVELGECWSAHEGNDGGFILRWGGKSSGVLGFGFGQIAFYYKNGVLHCDSEEMSKEFVQAVLDHFSKETLKLAVFDGE